MPPQRKLRAIGKPTDQHGSPARRCNNFQCVTNCRFCCEAKIMRETQSAIMSYGDSLRRITTTRQPPYFLRCRILRLPFVDFLSTYSFIFDSKITWANSLIDLKQVDQNKENYKWNVKNYSINIEINVTYAYRVVKGNYEVYY